MVSFVRFLPNSACMWIASKMEDMTPPRTEELVYISDHSFTSERLCFLETRICRELQFRLHRVTPFHFVHVYLRASQACASPSCHHFLDHAVMQQMTFYLLELSRSCYMISHRKPSLLAAACVYLARATLGLRDKQPNGENVFWTKTLEYYTGYSVDGLKDTVLEIHRLQTAAEKNSSHGVTPAFAKYKTEAYLRVSWKTVRRVEDLGLATTMKHEDINVNEVHTVIV
jgi:cyclin-A